MPDSRQAFPKEKEEADCADKQPDPTHHVSVARELHHEVASEAVRALHDDRPRAIAHQALQHLREAGTGTDGVCAADRRVPVETNISRLRLVIEPSRIGSKLFQNGWHATCLSRSSPA